MTPSSKQLVAGRELDALVAERVIGLKVGERGLRAWRNDDGLWVDIPRLVALRPSDSPNTWGGQRWENLRAYSTDMAAAWEVVEKLIATRVGSSDPARWYVRVWNCYDTDNNAPWVAVIHDTQERHKYVETALTAPLAICLAALEAVSETPLEVTKEGEE